LFILPHTYQAFLLQPIVPGFYAFYYLNKSIRLFAHKILSSRVCFIPQDGKLSGGIILHLYTNKEEMILPKMEDEGRFTEGLLPVAFKKHTKATIDLCVKDIEVFWFLTSCL
jgi:hypothetical protein